jgi:hypothetical protein
MPHDTIRIKIKVVTSVIKEQNIFNILDRIVECQMNLLVPSPGKKG